MFALFEFSVRQLHSQPLLLHDSLCMLYLFDASYYLVTFILIRKFLY